MVTFTMKSSMRLNTPAPRGLTPTRSGRPCGDDPGDRASLSTSPAKPVAAEGRPTGWGIEASRFVADAVTERLLDDLTRA